jgi:hypothetical protein
MAYRVLDLGRLWVSDNSQVPLTVSKHHLLNTNERETDNSREKKMKQKNPLI